MIDGEAKPLGELVNEIAVALGADWKQADGASETTADLKGPDGLALHFSTGSYWAPRGMIHVRGEWPDGARNISLYDIKTVSINASRTKSAAQVTKDIQRRLMPLYVERFAEVRKKIEEQEKFTNGRDALLARVAKITGGRIQGEMVYGPGYFGDIQVSSPTSLRLTGHCLYLTVEQLEKIKAAVPELFRERS